MEKFSECAIKITPKSPFSDFDSLGLSRLDFEFVKSDLDSSVTVMSWYKNCDYAFAEKWMSSLPDKVKEMFEIVII